MYWKDMYSSPQAAERALRIDARSGGRHLTAVQRHVAQVAVRQGLGDIGSLKSFFKKVVKTANKLDPLYSVRKKFDPVTKAVDRAAGITSAPKSTPAIAAPATVPGAALVPVSATVPVSTLQPDFNFAPSGGGGGGFSPATPDASATATDSGVPMWVWIGGGVVVLGALYFLMRKK